LKRFAAAAKLMPLFGNVRERSFFWTQEKKPERFAGFWIWTCPAYVPVSELIYAAFRSNAKGLLPPSDE
jgi:hypothetical protein